MPACFDKNGPTLRALGILRGLQAFFPGRSPGQPGFKFSLLPSRVHAHPGATARKASRRLRANHSCKKNKIMPLTISHPAASVPFARLNLPLSALAIGSMTPDFPYFIPILFSQSGFSHSIVGVFLYCLPIGVVSLGIFHFLIKYPALSLLPINHQRRLLSATTNFSFFPLRRFFLIILSIILGAFTHILWDSFTHSEGWMVKQFAILKSSVFVISSHSVLIFEILQHGSTLIGGVLLFYWYVEWYKDAKSIAVPQSLIIAAQTKVIIFAVAIFTALAIAIISVFVNSPVFQTPLYQLYLYIEQIFIVGVVSFVLEFILFSFYWHFNSKKKNAV
jgi:hypothetical protein